jgi:hypothetical protein
VNEAMVGYMAAALTARPVSVEAGRIAAGAVSDLLAGPRWCCEHVIGGRGEPCVILACCRHPAAGLMCPTCFAHHLAAEDETAPTCGRCGGRQLRSGVMFGLWDSAERRGVTFRHPLIGDATTCPGASALMIVPLCPLCDERRS